MSRPTGKLVAFGLIPTTLDKSSPADNGQQIIAQGTPLRG